jgi:hypothetical protein
MKTARSPLVAFGRRRAGAGSGLELGRHLWGVVRLAGLRVVPGDGVGIEDGVRGDLLGLKDDGVEQRPEVERVL